MKIVHRRIPAKSEENKYIGQLPPTNSVMRILLLSLADIENKLNNYLQKPISHEKNNQKRN